MAWPCPHWPQTVFFGGDAGEEQCSWGPPDSRARSPTGRSQGSGKRHGDVEEYPSADRDRFFIGKKAPFLHYFLGPSDVRWQTLPTLKREDPSVQDAVGRVTGVLKVASPRRGFGVPLANCFAGVPDVGASVSAKRVGRGAAQRKTYDRGNHLADVRGSGTRGGKNSGGSRGARHPTHRPATSNPQPT